MKPLNNPRKFIQIGLLLLAALCAGVAGESSASAQSCGHSGWPCCPDVYLGSIDDCCAKEFGICIPFSCAYIKCTCNAGHTNVGGFCVPCGSEFAPACIGKCCQWWGSNCIQPCPCDPGLVNVGGICLDPNNPVNCALDPCQAGCSAHCNPLCDDDFDPCNCAEFEYLCCAFQPCNSKCEPQCNPLCTQFDLCECAGVGCGCPTAGSCCNANYTAGCTDPICCGAVCAFIPECCDEDHGWDQTCAAKAKEICPLCNPCVQDPCNPGCGGECNPILPCYNACACGPCHPACFDGCACAGESVCNPLCDIFDPCACAGVDCPCGGLGELPCPCTEPPFLCCDDGLGIDTGSGAHCTDCWLGSQPYECLSDGRGQIGQPPWEILSAEFLRTYFHRCDRGLAYDPVSGTCVNLTRHSPQVQQFKNSSWTSKAMKLQRSLNNQMPVTQGQRLASHNSYNNAVDLAPLFQHSYSLSDQLDMGVRTIELDAHWSHIAWPDFMLKDVRLAHARPNHAGMMPTDRPYRHAIEELSIWIKNNPGEVVFISLEMKTDNTNLGGSNASNHLIPPIEHFLGPYLFRPSQFDQLGGDWRKIRPQDILNLGKRVVVIGDKVGSLPSNQNAIIERPDPDPSWTSSGSNGVNAFLASYAYDPETGKAAAGDPALFSSFTGDPSAFSCEFLLDHCINAMCGPLQCDIPGFTHPACAECEAKCHEWCAEPAFDGPGDFGITTPWVVRQMMRAGVNEIGLCPIGTSIAGVTGGYEPVTMPFEPLMNASVWSWMGGHPVIYGIQPQFARGALVIISGWEADMPQARFFTQVQSQLQRVAALSPDGKTWAITQGTASFANAANLVQQEFPGWHFAVPGNGLQMQRLADVLYASDASAVWVNYHAPPAVDDWQGKVVPESLANSAPVGCGALLFDGQDDHVDVGTLGNFGAEVGTSTIEFWIRTDNTSKIMSALKVIDDLPGLVDPVFGVELNRTWSGGATCAAGGYHAGRTLFFLRDTTGKMFARTIDANIYDGKWYHIAWVIEDANLSKTQVYIDGSPVESFTTQCNQKPSAFQPWTIPLAIGAANNRGNIEANLDGALDEVRLWTVARSAAEIKDNRNKLIDPATPGLFGYWRFDEGQGSTAYDWAGVNDGTLVGPPAWLVTGTCDSTPPPPPPVPGDFNGDGVVGVADLLILLAAWGPCANPAPGQCPADLNNDGIVGVADLLILLSNWG